MSLASDLSGLFRLNITKWNINLLFLSMCFSLVCICVEINFLTPSIKGKRCWRKIEKILRNLRNSIICLRSQVIRVWNFLLLKIPNGRFLFLFVLWNLSIWENFVIWKSCCATLAQSGTTKNNSKMSNFVFTLPLYH